jgi:hypothetical protein
VVSAAEPPPFSRPEPLLFLPSTFSFMLTRLSGPRSRLTVTVKIWKRQKSKTEPLCLQPGALTTRPQRRSATQNTRNMGLQICESCSMKPALPRHKDNAGGGATGRGAFTPLCRPIIHCMNWSESEIVCTRNRTWCCGAQPTVKASLPVLLDDGSRLLLLLLPPPQSRLNAVHCPVQAVGVAATPVQAGTSQDFAFNLSVAMSRSVLASSQPPIRRAPMAGVVWTSN